MAGEVGGGVTAPLLTHRILPLLSPAPNDASSVKEKKGAVMIEEEFLDSASYDRYNHVALFDLLCLYVTEKNLSAVYTAPVHHYQLNLQCPRFHLQLWW